MAKVEKVRPVHRWLAAFACPSVITLGLLFFPLGGAAERPWLLAGPSYAS
jgi:hypothetical protein